MKTKLKLSFGNRSSRLSWSHRSTRTYPWRGSPKRSASHSCLHACVNQKRQRDKQLGPQRHEQRRSQQHQQLARHKLEQRQGGASGGCLGQKIPPKKFPLLIIWSVYCSSHWAFARDMLRPVSACLARCLWLVEILGVGPGWSKSWMWGPSMSALVLIS